MRMLLINTAGAGGTVALVEGVDVLAVELLPGRGTSEALMPAVRRLLPQGLGGLDIVGVVIGPGSFTGIRVGLSAAKGLCEAGALRMVALSRLELVADGVDAPAVLDGGRGEFYVGGAGALETLLSEDEVRRLIAERGAVTCEARVAERLGIRLSDEPGAEAMLAMVLARAAADEWTDVALADANYIRRTDAELMKTTATAGRAVEGR